MDILNLQPDAVGKTDDTFEVEGYEDQIEEIKNEFPEEDFRTPEEIAAAEALQQELTPEENIQPTVVEAQNPNPEQVEQPQAQAQPKLFIPDEYKMISDEQLAAAYNGKLPAEGLRRGLKMNYAYIPIEDEVNELLTTKMCSPVIIYGVILVISLICIYLIRIFCI